MDFTQLQNFKLLAEYEHMTRAANALHMAQPALSRMLRNLEREIGLLLFERDGKNLKLNENGRVLLYHANLILKEVEEARNVLSDRKGAKARNVRLAMCAATGLLPDIIRSFSGLHPDISLTITQSVPHGAEPHDKCDILVSSAAQPPESANCTVLLRENVCLAVPASHPLSTRKSVRLFEAAGLPFISLHKGSGLRAITDAYCFEAGFRPQIVLESDSPSIVRQLIALGVGMAFIPTLTWAGIDYGPDIALVEIEDPKCVRYIYMQWRENRYITGAAKTLQKHLVEFFAGLEGGKQP